MSIRDKNAKILDCTIRDGGLINNWDFSKEFVRDVYQSLSQAGVDYMEIGYQNSPNLVKSDNIGPWRFVNEDLIREVIPEKTGTKLSALVDIGRVEEKGIIPSKDSYLDLIRVACYVNQVGQAIELIKKYNSLGYETTINIMAVSNAPDLLLLEALDKINESPVDIVYIVDSFGSLRGKDIEYLINKFKSHLPDKELGLHTHNNQQLAFANTLVGTENGVTFLDSSIYGMGRAAGNCPTELLVNYLDNPKYDIKSLLDIIERRFIPLREEIEWGYLIPYMVTGILNEHPRLAMQMRNTPDKDKYVELYDKLTLVETSYKEKTDSKKDSEKIRKIR